MIIKENNAKGMDVILSTQVNGTIVLSFFLTHECKHYERPECFSKTDLAGVEHFQQRNFHALKS